VFVVVANFVAKMRKIINKRKVLYMNDLIASINIFQFLILVFIAGGAWVRLSKVEKSIEELNKRVFNGLSERLTRLEQKICDKGL